MKIQQCLLLVPLLLTLSQVLLGASRSGGFSRPPGDPHVQTLLYIADLRYHSSRSMKDFEENHLDNGLRHFGLPTPATRVWANELMRLFEDLERAKGIMQVRLVARLFDATIPEEYYLASGRWHSSRQLMGYVDPVMVEYLKALESVHHQKWSLKGAATPVPASQDASLAKTVARPPAESDLARTVPRTAGGPGLEEEPGSLAETIPAPGVVPLNETAVRTSESPSDVSGRGEGTGLTETAPAAPSSFYTPKKTKPPLTGTRG